MSDKSLAVVPQTFTEIQSMADVLCKSALLPDALKNKAADVAFTIMCGAELGLGPIASIRGIYIIQGKPTLSADTMMGLVLGSGLAEYFVQSESSDTSVTFETKRKGSPIVQKCTWTIEQAKRAGVTSKDTWRLFPRQMLAARAKAELCRSAYPDILAATYDPDELHVPVRVESTDAEFVDIPAAPVDDPLLAEIESAADADALKALGTRCNALPKSTPQRKAVVAAYKAKLATFDAPPVEAAAS